MKTKLKKYFLLASISFFAISSAMAQTTSSDYDDFLAGIITETGQYGSDSSNAGGGTAGNGSGNNSGVGNNVGNNSGNSSQNQNSSGHGFGLSDEEAFAQGSLREHYSSTEELMQDRDRYLNQKNQTSGSTMSINADDTFDDLINRKSTTLYDDVENMEDTYLDTQKRTWNLNWLMKLLKALFVVVPTIDGPVNAVEPVEVSGAGADTAAAAQQEKTGEEIKDAYGSDNLSEYGIDAPEMEMDSLYDSKVTILSGIDLSDMRKISEVTEENILVQTSIKPKDITEFEHKKEVFVQENIIEILAKVLYIKKQISVLEEEMNSLASKAGEPDNKDQEQRYQYQAHELYSKMLAYRQVLVSLKLQLGAVKGLQNSKTLPSSLLNETEE